jgi:hypothetical protein
MSITVNIMPEGFKEAEEALKGVKNGFPKAMSRAINTGLLAGRTVASKMIRARYNLTAGSIKGGLYMHKASSGHLGGTLEAKGPMLPMSAFNPRVKIKNSYQNVYVAIVRGKAKFVKGAFQIHGSRIMERRQPERHPIYPVSVIGIPFMLRSHQIMPEVQRRMMEASSKALKHNTDFYLGKIALESRKFK